MLRGNRQKLSVYGAGRVIVGAELLQPFGYAPAPCGIFVVTIYESPPSVMPCCRAACRSIHYSGLDER
jgi:hypothetical protein